MQAVIVAVAHVAQGHAVQRKAQLVLVEAAQRNARRPFIGTKGVARLEVDAGQLADCLERRGAGGEQLDIVCGDRLHLARFAKAVDDDFVAGICVGSGSGFSGRNDILRLGKGWQQGNAGNGSQQDKILAAH